MAAVLETRLRQAQIEAMTPIDLNQYKIAVYRRTPVPPIPPCGGLPHDLSGPASTFGAAPIMSASGPSDQTRAAPITSDCCSPCRGKSASRTRSGCSCIRTRIAFLRNSELVKSTSKGPNRYIHTSYISHFQVTGPVKSLIMKSFIGVSKISPRYFPKYSIQALTVVIMLTVVIITT
jgi:hypothetical protein